MSFMVHQSFEGPGTFVLFWIIPLFCSPLSFWIIYFYVLFNYNCSKITGIVARSWQEASNMGLGTLRTAGT